MNKATLPRVSPELRSVPAFSPVILSPHATELAGIPLPTKVEAGTKLIEQGEFASFVALIHSGIVRLTFLNDEGSRTILGLRSQGSWLNINPLLLSVPSICTVTTLTECSLSKLDEETFSAWHNKHPLESKDVLLGQCREILMLQQHSIMRESKARDRLAYLESESRYSVWQTIDPTLVLPQNEIAELLSISPEHLSCIRQDALTESSGTLKKKRRRGEIN